jgi:selenocysteine lyase/cysteine desulfurase
LPALPRYFTLPENNDAKEALLSDTALEKTFAHFRRGIIGIDQTFPSPYGEQKLLYADWTASGRLYAPIEARFREQIAPFVANTHTEATRTGSLMTAAYQHSLTLIKEHVNANDGDVIIAAGSGMTRVINKFQRLLGLRLHEDFLPCLDQSKIDRPVVFVTHMEHHSNHTSWHETIAEVVIIEPDAAGLPDIEHFRELLDKYGDRPRKYAALSAGSNVTGIIPNYQEMTRLIHRAGGYSFVDFACSAPYINIDMHPDDPELQLDAITFSPHKFLGGPGSAGILVFRRDLYHQQVPDQPGGGTVLWTNPWGDHCYNPEIEMREDGGTPAFLQTMRTAFAIRLKEEMQSHRILAREEELLDIIWPGLQAIPGLHILAENQRQRLGIISFVIDGLHYNLIVRLLNDRYGIQVRSGCVCAGTYGHYLFNVSRTMSEAIKRKVLAGDLRDKPGWVRLSIHPTMSTCEAELLVSALSEIAEYGGAWEKDYIYHPPTNEFRHRDKPDNAAAVAREWFTQPLS